MVFTGIYQDEKFSWSYQCGVGWPNDYIGPDSMTWWIVEKSDGFTDVGLYRVSESVRAYAYLIRECICRMVEFLIDNIFLTFGGCLFRQVIWIPMGTNCAPLLADLLLYSYESEFLDMIRGGHRKPARLFNLCYRYMDDLIVFNNKKFGDYVKEIYSSRLTVEKANTSDDLAN